MSIFDRLRRDESWREKAGTLRVQLDAIAAEREKLEGAASAALLSGDDDNGRGARDQRLHDLAARTRDLQRAIAEAESRAAADEAAAEAEHRRRETEAARQRRAEAEAAYLEQVLQVERGVQSLAASFSELVARGAAIAEIDGSNRAARFFDGVEIADRLAMTSWKYLALLGTPENPRCVFPYSPGSYQGARQEFREGEALLVAGLHERGREPATRAA